MKLSTSTCVAIAALTLSAAAQANILTFEPTGNCSTSANSSGIENCGDYSYFNQSYGDTAFVDISYLDANTPTDSLRYWNADYNNLRGVLFASGGDANSHARIVLTATAGYEVNLQSFDLGAYSLTERGTFVRVSSSSTPSVFAYDGLVGTGNVATAFSGFGASGMGNQVTIDFYNSAYNVGIDNIQFNVSAVPEPETFAMLLAGLGLLGAVARRKRTV